MTKRAPTLAALARQINAALPSLEAIAEPGKGYCNTDSRVAGTRFRREGRGRWGTLLTVRVRATGEVLFRHNAAETYRHNGEVVAWLETMKATGREPRNLLEEHR